MTEDRDLREKTAELLRDYAQRIEDGEIRGFVLFPVWHEGVDGSDAEIFGDFDPYDVRDVLGTMEIVKANLVVDGTPRIFGEQPLS